MYEVTLLTDNATNVVAKISDLFDLDVENFVPINSDHFGYDGTLTLFSSDELHRFEVIAPRPGDKTMRRFFERVGTSNYMAYADSDCLLTIEREVEGSGLGITIRRPEERSRDETPDQLWIHPPVLGGMMLGISRPTMAWTWSGHPDRVCGPSI